MKGDTFPIVGVGASAGGLEALRTMFGGNSEKCGMAFVVVQHLDPTHESLMAQLIERYTKMTVTQASGGERVEPDHVYVIPPAHGLALKNGVLELTDFTEQRGMRRPIDDFFESLARDQEINAACVILSGTGADGSRGLRAIKEHGGLAIAQEPSSASYDGMPSSAISTGLVDVVSPPENIIEALDKFFSRAAAGEGPFETSDEVVDHLDNLCTVLRDSTGHDLSRYKQTTLVRRIARRMQLLGLESAHDYLSRLRDDETECYALFRDLLINVTRFFRDKQQFDLLAEEVIQPLVARTTSQGEIRVWVPGCSSGEEAYTIAMLFADAARRQGKNPYIQIFATDIDDKMLEIARSATYPLSALDDVPQNFRDTYIIGGTDKFTIAPHIRDMVRFSEHNLVRDPPFSKIDLISCRNVLIYFNDSLQRSVIPLFHFALTENGRLFLGSSEAIGRFDDLFETVDQSARLFRRKNVQGRYSLQLSRGLGNQRRPAARIEDIHDRPNTQGPEIRALQVIARRYGPVSLLLDHEGILLERWGKAGRYLDFPDRLERNVHIPTLARPGLRELIGPLIRKASETGRRAGSKDVEIRTDFGTIGTLVICEPIDSNAFLFVIEETSPLDTSVDDFDELDIDDGHRRFLEEELQATRHRLRTTVEELETTNEELKSSNEEMMSMNEELQSANEELSTTNEELQGKVAELRKANDDMSNLMSSTKIVTIFLDSDLRLRFFTPESLSVFRFMDSDRGRHLKDIASDVNMDALVQMCQSVLDTGASIEEEMSTDSGDRRFMLKIEAYSGDTQSATAGVVCTMADITALSRAISEADLERQSSQRRLAEIEQLYHVSPQAMALLKPDATYLRINRQMAEIDGVEVDDHIGKRIQDVLPDLVDQTTRAFETVLETGKAVTGFRLEGTTLAHPNDRRLFMTDWYPVHTEGELVAIGVNVRDVTEQTEMQAELRRMMRELQHRVKNMLSNVLALVSRAGREVTTDAEVLEALAARIKALSGTHKLLTKENWRAADIYDLLEPELTDVYGTDRIKLKGPKLTLNARAAVAFGMAIHELATNAAKYGAFSTDAGSVSFKWVRTDDGEAELVIFRWVERGGPRVEEPRHAGFGSQLVTSTITGSLHGALKMDWHPEGLSVEISIPTDELTKIGEDVIYDIF